METLNWEYACASDRIRACVIMTLFKHHPQLIHEVFEDQRPRLKAAPATIKRSPRSHGEKVLIKLALDIWNDSGKSKVMEVIETLDHQNFEAFIQALSLRRNPSELKTNAFLNKNAIHWL